MSPEIYSGVTIFTIGHSNRELAVLLDLLRDNRIETIVDVRAQPSSRRHPQFDRDRLQAAVESQGAVYHWVGHQLGGMRTPSRSSPHRGLDEKLRGYADYMDREPFRRAVRQLVQMARMSRTVILCAEREPEHCHRGLISDFLSLRGVDVQHIVANGHVRDHVLHPAARRESLQLIYDRHVNDELELE